MGFLAFWTYFALAVFVLGCLWKAVRYATMPMHLRWELYPVAHEKGKASYGGSYFEELDWWTKPRESSKVGEIVTIMEEVFTLKQVRENNRGLWLWSLLFHWGIYLLFLLGVGLVAGAVAMAAGLEPLFFLAGGKTMAVWGAVALVLATLGAVGLLLRRLSDGGLRRSSTPADFFHLVLLLALLGASWGAWITVDRQYMFAGAFLTALVTGKGIASASAWVTAEVVLLGIFLAYLPFSHMSHFFTKYFTWHSVRWEDRPNLPGEGIDARAAKLLMLPVSWSAPHIRGGGTKTWVDVAQEEGGDS